MKWIDSLCTRESNLAQLDVCVASCFILFMVSWMESLLQSAISEFGGQHHWRSSHLGLSYRAITFTVFCPSFKSFPCCPHGKWSEGCYQAQAVVRYALPILSINSNSLYSIQCGDLKLASGCLQFLWGWTVIAFLTGRFGQSLELSVTMNTTAMQFPFCLSVDLPSIVP
jgi:hypothetical protein